MLEFKGRHREMMQPNRYTELFFLDEATALAAGHRPCFECRRADAERFAELWAKAHGGDERGARARDGRGAACRARSAGDRSKRHVSARGAATCPSGAFVRYARGPGGRRAALSRCRPSASRLEPGRLHGAGARRLALAEEVEVLTPPSIVAVLSAGYRPMLHPSAAALLG